MKHGGQLKYVDPDACQGEIIHGKLRISTPRERTTKHLN